MANPVSRKLASTEIGGVRGNESRDQDPECREVSSREKSQQNQRRHTRSNETLAGERKQKIDGEKQGGYCQCEPDPPGEPDQLPSLRLADERERS